MLEKPDSDVGDVHRTVWELIPWYVNGTLPASEMEMVQRHLETCPVCEAEVHNQMSLAKKVAVKAPFGQPLSRSWDKLREQIQAEKKSSGDAS
ncbi:zf-HC2 domain-containing protein [Roseibium sp. RKSG952]|uniref:zf-HC2 domain-containing protein n=1 Tax=Roseibium sp. RKSG952 TaxID=2529384 RepID=UPI0018AD1983|nr:zf-HC2 domain-containing protein [Roseibium sp. RKSG952]